MSESTASPQLVEYKGNCHCGAFKFVFKAAELKQVMACNCSICAKKGVLWAFPSRAEDFVVVKGDENSTLATYEFGKRTMVHKFCPTCGTSIMARMHTPPDGFAGFAVNVRAFEDVDLEVLEVSVSDGAAREPLYEEPKAVDAGPVPEGETAYHGGCHCGAVGYTVHSPKKIEKARKCNCSICSREGALWTYPVLDTVTFKGLDSVTEYTFSRKLTFHAFCKICGVPVRERFTDPIDGNLTALNVRTMNGKFDVSALHIEKFDNKKREPLYVVS
ncbi:glutathione-dependent formaldehyde-activating enzyme [Mycena crocata]|nr:glutathione-dependent formaldehyde-activating enzyme [Mycena crocata]